MMTTKIGMKAMRTKIFVPQEHFKEVNAAIRKSNIRFFPFRRLYRGYEIEFETSDHPLTTFLLLKYEGIKTLV